MQINSNRTSEFYSLTPVAPLERLPVPYKFSTALPVVIEEKASNSSAVMPVADENSSQQARFVRQFISTERDMTAIESEQDSNFLSRPMQLYHLVGTLTDNGGTKGRVLDTKV